MKKFEFSLQKVLQYKSHIQKLEQDTLRQMQMDYEKLRAKKEELVANYERCKKEYLERCKEGVLAGDVAATYAYISDLQMQMKVLDKKINQAAAQINLQIERLLAATKEKTSLQKLREKCVAAYAAQETKENELFINEFVSYTAAST